METSQYLRRTREQVHIPLRRASIIDDRTNITSIKLLNLICLKVLYPNSKRVTASLQSDCPSLSEKGVNKVHLFTSALALVIYVSKLPLGACSIRACSISKLRERSGSVVECLTRDRRAAGSSLTGVTALQALSKTYLS